MTLATGVDVKTHQRPDRRDCVLTIKVGVFVKSKWHNIFNTYFKKFRTKIAKPHKKTATEW